MSKEINVTQSSFESEVIQSAVPVIADFWAPWCGPCQMIGPVLEEISEEYDGKIKVAKINVDKEAELAGNYGVTGIPCIVLFNNGAEVKRHVGAAGKDVLEKLFVDLI